MFNLHSLTCCVLFVLALSHHGICQDQGRSGIDVDEIWSLKNKKASTDTPNVTVDGNRQTQNTAYVTGSSSFEAWNSRELEIAKYKSDLQKQQIIIKKLMEQNKAIESNRQHGSRLHSALIEKLLESQNPNNQLVALDHLLAVGEKNALESIDYYPVLPNCLAKVAGLVESDNAPVQKHAIRALKLLHRDLAEEMGFQSGEYWHSIPRNIQESTIRAAMRRLSDFEYDSVPLQEVKHDIEMRHQINVAISSEIDLEQEITLDLNNVTLHSGLEALSKNYGITYVVKDESLYLLKPESPDRMSTLVYNVRGLMTTERQLAPLIQIAQEQLSADGSVVATGKHQLVITASEPAHHKVATVFGTLNVAQ